MAADLITLMDFESGEMSQKDMVEMIADMIADGTIDNEDDRFRKLAKKYIAKGVIDEEGNINYIKLNMLD